MPPRIRFVLLRPRIAENVGAAARILKNFGFAEWSIVEPAFDDWVPARRMAVQSDDVLDQVARPASLAEAVADCIWVVGTSSRRRHGQRSHTPRDFASEAIKRSAEGTIALVFGDERSGLANDVLDQCHDVSTIATTDAQPSINLAQSMALYAYEISLARHAAEPHAEGAIRQKATEEMLHALHEVMRDALTKGRFLHDTRDGVLGDLMAPLVRSRLTRREADLWMAALRAITRDH